MEVIKKIELKTGAELIPLTIDEIYGNTPGYASDQDGNIIGLNLQDLNLSAIDFLKDFGDLSYLNLASNHIEDLFPLKYLSHLEFLSLENNELSDISTLKDIPRLKTLNLCLNQISDISALKKFENLEELDLSCNRISNITALRNLVGLIDLDLIDNQVSDISVLRHLSNLTRLALSENQITDISAVGSLINLTYLSLHYNPIPDFSPLKYLKNLTDIYISNHKKIRLPPEIDDFHATIRLVGKDGQIVKIKTRKGSHKKTFHSEVFKTTALPFLFVILIVCGFLIIQGFKLSKKYQEMFDYGIRGAAVVTLKEERQGNRGGKNYYIEYSYNDKNNITYRGSRYISKYEEWARIKTGEKMSITYDGNNPQNHLPFIVEESMIYKPLYDSIKFTALIIGIILVFFSLVYIFMKFRR